MVWSGFVGMSIPGRVFPAIMENGRDQACPVRSSNRATVVSFQIPRPSGVEMLRSPRSRAISRLEVIPGQTALRFVAVEPAEATRGSSGRRLIELRPRRLPDVRCADGWHLGAAGLAEGLPGDRSAAKILRNQ